MLVWSCVAFQVAFHDQPGHSEGGHCLDITCVFSTHHHASAPAIFVSGLQAAVRSQELPDDFAVWNLK